MKKLITFLLVAIMACTAFACGDPGTSPTPTPTPTVPGPTGPVGPVEGDELAFNWQVEGDAAVTYPTTPLLVGSAAQAGATYTYRVATSKLPSNWNIHDYQTNDATTVLDYTTDSLYTFDYNLTQDGYRILPSMANAYPVDVTADYVGQYGIEEGAKNRAYKITLKDNLKFDNGDPITAATFVESMQLLLNPEALNYRADSYFKGNLIIHGAEAYALQGTTVVTGAENKHDTWAAAQEDEDVYFDLMSNNTQFGAFGAANYSSYKDETYGWAKLLKAYGAIENIDEMADLQGLSYAEIAADAAKLEKLEAILEWWCTEPEEEMSFFAYDRVMPAYDWEDVGFLADTDENAIIIINDKELSGFYQLYSLASDFFLVHPETYRACITESQGVYANSYGTSVDTYVGFGPYKLSYFLADALIKFEKNPNWHGYADPNNANYYHTTNIEISMVTSEATRLNMFLQGQLDSYGLQAADMEDYQGSPHTYFTDGDSTWFVALNPDLAGLTAAQEEATPQTEGNEVNKTIITIKEFRQALSFSLDRAAYALELDPLGGTAKALYGNMIISDPNTGTAYRTTEEAKDTILKFWGLDEEVGPDGLYATKDEAIAAITGYDPVGAKALFTTAYEKAVEQGLISAAAAESGNFEIQLMIGKPSEAAYYNNGFNVLKQTWTEAVVGTPLEGKLAFVQSATLGQNFSDYLKDNTVDVLFGVGWTGSTLDPYGLMEAYVAPSYQYDPGWDTSATDLDITLTDNDGVSYTLRASVHAWGAEALAGIEIKAMVVEDGELTGDYVMIEAGTTCNADIRLAILAAVEGAVLQQYDMIPVNLDSSANLKGMKIKYGTEEYVFGVGRGGIKYMTYNYTDAEWDAFVASQGGTLNYK